MTIKSTFEKLAVTAFKIFDSVTLICTYTSKGTISYDPSTGTPSSTDIDYGSRKFIFASYNESEIDNEHILETHVKGMIPKNKLNITPKAKDIITTSASRVYSVVTFKYDPAEALWIFQLEPGGS